MKNLLVGNMLFQKDYHERYGHDRGCFLIFEIAPKNLQKHTETQTGVCLIISLNILYTAVPIRITDD
jgi:hypothetical protein